MIRMANQIAAFFEAYSRSEALDGIAAHIRNYWTPRMRTQLTEYIEGGAEGLSPAGHGGHCAEGQGEILTRACRDFRQNAGPGCRQ